MASWPHYDEVVIKPIGKRWGITTVENRRLCAHGLRKGFKTLSAAMSYARITGRDTITIRLRR